MSAVLEQRSHPAEPAAEPIARRVRQRLGLPADPPIPRPRTRRIDAPRRSWLSSALAARVAVRAGVPLDDHLRARLAHHLAALPVPRERLPLQPEIDDGQIAVRRPAPGVEPGPAPDEDAWLAPLVALEGPAVRQEVASLEIRASVLEGELDDARRRAGDLARALAGDVAQGLVPAPSAVDATAEQLGRPPVRSGAPHALALLFAVVLLAAETWQLASPLLAASGLAPGAVAATFARAPVEVVLPALFALGIAGALFALAVGGLAAAAEVLRAEVAPSRRRGLAAAGLAALAVSVLLALAVAALPGGADAPAPTAALLLLALPLAAALALQAARGDRARRQEELARALEWDRARAHDLLARARRAEELEWADEQVRQREAAREAARRRLRELSARAVEAGRVAAEAARREREALARVAQGLVAALELDRFEYLRQAGARGAADLVRRRKPEVRAVAEPAPAAEAGRLAS
jgi:hypothetical protein